MIEGKHIVGEVFHVLDKIVSERHKFCYSGIHSFGPTIRGLISHIYVDGYGNCVTTIPLYVYVKSTICFGDILYQVSEMNANEIKLELVK